ncbi:hypothetical protein ACWERW_15700 [Streptomyces sp. NPDC004012]
MPAGGHRALIDAPVGRSLRAFAGARPTRHTRTDAVASAQPGAALHPGALNPSPKTITDTEANADAPAP